MNRLSILVVDDYQDIQKLLCTWLETQKHRVKCASSGNEALALLKKCRFDLVVTDILMPNGRGDELIAKIRKKRSRVRILAISGGGPHMSSPTCLQVAHGVGAHALLRKPFNEGELLATIGAVCQNVGSQDK